MVELVESKYFFFMLFIVRLHIADLLSVEVFIFQLFRISCKENKIILSRNLINGIYYCLHFKGCWNKRAKIDRKRKMVNFIFI